MRNVNQNVIKLINIYDYNDLYVKKERNERNKEKNNMKKIWAFQNVC